MSKKNKHLIVLFSIIFLSLTIGHSVFALENEYPGIPVFAPGGLNNNSTIVDFITYFFGLAVVSAGILGVLSSLVYYGNMYYISSDVNRCGLIRVSIASQNTQKK